MLDFLIDAARGLAKEFRNRRELRDLLQKDDRILQDIGLTRADVESALSKPMGINARHDAVRLSQLAFYLSTASAWPPGTKGACAPPGGAAIWRRTGDRRSG